MPKAPAPKKLPKKPKPAPSTEPALTPMAMAHARRKSVKDANRRPRNRGRS